VNNFTFFELKNSYDRIIRGSVHSVGTETPDTLFIFSHGLTSQRMGPEYLFVKISRFLAANNIASVRFDFTGSGESDGEFCDMSLDTMKCDLLTVTNHFKRTLKPSKVFLLGHSIGGMVVALSVKEILADGIVLIAPVADTRKFFTERKVMSQIGVNSRGFFEYGPHELSPNVFDALQNVNPSVFLSENFKGKMLLIQGSSDPTVLPEESLLYINESKRSGVSGEYTLIQGANHNFTRVDDVNNLCQTILSWTKEQC
jgi:dipeptidyl aminopeptidase/acylaminoacyl peptidase